MPGPSGTLSRWAPTITTSAVDPVLVWAMTLRVCSTRTPALSLMVASPGAPRSRSPDSLVMLMTGIFGLVFSPSVPPISSPSSLLATINATAPRSAATACFAENWQAPRSTSTTAPWTGSPS